jgi:hypothetical protein
MKHLATATLFGTLLVGFNHSFADVPAATVTQALDKSTHSMTATGAGKSVVTGTVLHSGEFLKTGKTSLAEMVLENKTVTRVGPNTVLNYSVATHEADLQSGTMLFSKPKDGTMMTLNMSAVKAAVTGTTGFVERDGGNVMLGVIEGTVHVTVGSATTILHAGKMLVAAGTTAQVVSFDVPNFISTSAFFNRFQRTLPNERAVENEVAEYNNMVSRGFITPAQVTRVSGDRHESVVSRNGERETAGASANASVASSTGASSSTGFNISTSNSSTSSSLAVNGIAASGASLSREGVGTITLGGSNSYTGSTTVNGGTLALNGGGNAGGTGITLGASTSGTLAGLSSGFHGGTSLTPSPGTSSGGTIMVGSGSTVLGSGLTIVGSGSTILGGGTTTLGNGGIGSQGGTITNNTGSSITVGGVTIPPHGSVTIPGH